MHRRLRPTMLLLLCALAALGSPCSTATGHDSPQQGWTLVMLRDDIQVYVRQLPGSRLKAFRGITRFALPDQYALVAAMNDYAHYPRWIHYVHSAEELSRRSPLDRQLRFITRLPWPLNDREALLQATVSQQSLGPHTQVSIALHNAPELLPANDAYVRFPAMQGQLILRTLDEQRVEVVYELEMDLGGVIPSWLSNLALREAPYYTLSRLKRTLKRPEYQGQFFDYLDLAGPGRPPSGNAPGET